MQRLRRPWWRLLCRPRGWPIRRARRGVVPRARRWALCWPWRRPVSGSGRRHVPRSGRRSLSRPRWRTVSRAWRWNLSWTPERRRLQGPMGPMYHRRPWQEVVSGKLSATIEVAGTKFKNATAAKAPQPVVPTDQLRQRLTSNVGRLPVSACRARPKAAAEAAFRTKHLPESSRVTLHLAEPPTSSP